MSATHLSQSLRRRTAVLLKEVMALNATNAFSPPLTLNRLHAALYHELLDGSKYPHLTDDDFINHAVDLTNRSNLISLLQRYDFATRKRASSRDKQMLALVSNMIPPGQENREQVVTDTLAMVHKFTLVRSIPGIRTLVQARMNNQNQDIDELDYMHLR